MGVWAVVGSLVAIVAIMGLVLAFANRAERRDGGFTGESGASIGDGGDRTPGSHDGGADGGGGDGGGGGNGG